MASPPDHAFPPPDDGTIEGLLDPADSPAHGYIRADTEVGLEELATFASEQPRFDGCLSLDHAAGSQIGSDVRHDAGPARPAVRHDVQEGGTSARPTQLCVE